MMLRAAVAAICLALFGVTVGAQELPKPDPLEANLAAQWQAAQTGQQNVAEALGKLIEAYRKEKARADAAEAKLKKEGK